MSPKLKPETLEKRKAHILKAALTCFARKGYHQATMDDIVEAAGLSKGGVYWHYGSKKELFLALFESLMSPMGAVLEGSLESDASASEKLAAVMRMFTMISQAEEFKEVMPLLIDVWAQNWRDPEVNEVAITLYGRFRDPIVRLIEEGIASGELKAVKAPALAGMIMALYDGLMVQWMIDEKLVDWDAVSETVADTLMAGLLMPAAE